MSKPRVRACVFTTFAGFEAFQKDPNGYNSWKPNVHVKIKGGTSIEVGGKQTTYFILKSDVENNFINS
jgi:hypothetical protein